VLVLPDNECFIWIDLLDLSINEVDDIVFCMAFYSVTNPLDKERTNQDA
jgi:hypothetical protein